MTIRTLLSAMAVAWMAAPLTMAQLPKSAKLFDENCVKCHANVAGSTGPEAGALRRLTPEAIVTKLGSHGAVSGLSDVLSENDKQAIAEYLSGRNLMAPGQGDAAKMPNACKGNPPITSLTTAPAWNGWGADATNARYQTAKIAGIPANQVSRLKLKWAFGFPGGSSMYGQPTVAAGRVFIGLNNGFVYSIDAASGCAYWSFQARSGVRNAISIGEIKGQGAARFALYFGDVRANVYAVDASSGRLLWENRVDENSVAGITGAPALYDGRLYVPVSSREEGVGISELYPCCKFRGSVVALDANSGKQIWKSYVIQETPKPTHKNSAGTQMWGPGGGAVWNTPTIDPKNKALYIGTGNTYTEPGAPGTDAVMAMDLATGKHLWSVQDTLNDEWLACGPAWGNTDNCPKNMGPDFDFGASPILKTLPGGKRLLIAGQKSGMIWAHDPDQKGAVVWKTQIPEKLAIGEITFGGAADDEYAYFGVSSVGVAAVRLSTGERLWTTAIKAAGPRLGIGAAMSVIPGTVFGGGYDGIVRAISTKDGELVWQFNMMQDFKTVNGVVAKGGSMGSAGPVVAGGTVFVPSGYTFGERGTPGNALLAFSAE
jgi:polyvinyl alcohol dehydrogenase (cytochrome)